MLPAQPNQSLIDGLAVLQTLTVAERPLGVRELARRLDLEPTRANRLVKTLAHLGLARQDADRRYATGPAVHVLAAQTLFASGLFKRARQPLADLHDLELIVALGVRWRRHVCYIYHAEPGMDVAEAIGRMHLTPATESGIGMALLSRLDDAEIRRLYHDQSIERYQDIDGLLADLRAVHLTGHAVVDLRRRPLVRSVGVAVGRPAYAGLAVSGAIAKPQIPRIVERLEHAAQAIEPDPQPAHGD